MRYAIPLMLLVAAIGCSGGSNARQAVSGTVLYRGTNLDEGIVEFYPIDGPPGPAGSGLVRDGRYELPQEQGLKPGRYRVAVRAPDPDGPARFDADGLRMPSERIAARFNDQSTLNAEITPRGGPYTFAFEVE